MSEPHHTTFFSLLEALSLAAFAGGVGAHVYYWLGGRQATWRAGARLLREGARRLLTREAWSALLLDGIGQRRLLRLNLYRWLSHQFIFWGFALLFVVGSLGDFAKELGLWQVQKDTPWFAAVNDLWGLLLMAGVLMAMARRSKESMGQRVNADTMSASMNPLTDSPSRRNARENTLLGVWLLLLAVLGYLLEATRLLEQGLTAQTPFSFVGYATALALRPLVVTSSVVYDVLWWTHAVMGLGLVAYLPYSRLFHLFTTPLAVLLNSPRERESIIAGKWKMENGVGGRESGRVGDVSHSPILPFPHSSILHSPFSILHSQGVLRRLDLSACTRCKRCSDVCETFAAMPEDDTVSPSCKVRKFNSLLKSESLPPPLAKLLRGRPWDEESLREFAQGAYRCTLCSRCVEVCPAKMDLLSLWFGLREEMVRHGIHPKGLDQARAAIATERNVVNYPNADRDLWVDYLNDPPDDRFQKPRAQVLYYVGCMSSFSPAAQNIPIAFVEVMQRTGVDFAILGGQEWCCGFPLLAAGMRDAMEELVRHNAERVQQLGATTVVFNCPSCYNTWASHYRPYLPEGVRLRHSTQFLLQLIEEDKLRWNGTASVPYKSVTYHDPCDLGRNSGVYEEPRAVLRALKGVEFREAAQNRQFAHCCGGGGDLQISDADLALAVCISTLRQFEQTGADALVVACPQCKRMFDAAVKQTKSPMKLVDIIELVLETTNNPQS